MAEDMTRILVVAGVYPWPATDGYRQRLGALIATLTDLGAVEFWCFDDILWRQSGRVAEPPVAVSVRRTELIPTGRAARLWAWLTTGLPRPMTGCRRPLRSSIEMEQQRFDLALFSHLDAWHLFGSVVDAPAIVDLDNLEDLALRSRRDVGARMVRPRREHRCVAVNRARSVALELADRVDERRFARLQQRCAAEVYAVTLCSQLDVGRSGVTNARCIPNGYTLSWDSPARSHTASDPVLLFVGRLSYPPNEDAVRWFASSVLPLVRARVPRARFRVVGAGGENLSAELSELTGVEFVGAVEHLKPQLDSASVTVVPVRFGAGTRLKVIEAMANRIPLATTSLGCEGIDVEDGVHCLIGDDETSLAEACVRLLEDADLRGTLADAAETLYREHYRWSTIQQTFAQLAREATSSGPAR